MRACTMIVASPFASMYACDVVLLMEAFVLICGVKNVPLPSVCWCEESAVDAFVPSCSV